MISGERESRCGAEESPAFLVKPSSGAEAKRLGPATWPRTQQILHLDTYESISISIPISTSVSISISISLPISILFPSLYLRLNIHRHRFWPNIVHFNKSRVRKRCLSPSLWGQHGLPRNLSVSRGRGSGLEAAARRPAPGAAAAGLDVQQAGGPQTIRQSSYVDI